MSNFPARRLRRTRDTHILRSLVAENMLCASQLILPIFVQECDQKEFEIKSMEGVHRHSVNQLCDLITDAKSYGIKSFALFPCVKAQLKTSDAKESYNPDNLLCRAIKTIKAHFAKDVVLIADVALDPYTTSGHDGITKDDKVLNDETLEVLCKQSLVLAGSGADIIAPSDMMDGRVDAIRYALDTCGFKDTIILSYAAKYASCLYFPFREAIGSLQYKKIDKSSYQLDCRNLKEAMTEIKYDLQEGADIIMIKPATFYLDVIKSAADRFDIPIFAYQVSGEYQMFKKHGGIKMILESLVAIKRAGATSIVTYAAVDIAKIINNYD